MSLLDDLPPQVLAQLRCKPEPDFICAVCGKHVDCRYNPRGSGREIPPICNICERVSGYDWTGRPRYRANLRGGSFMDRRNATRILALSEELAAAAQRTQWSEKYGSA